MTRLARHPLLLAVATVWLLAGCDKTTTACQLLARLFGSPPPIVQYAKGPAPEYHQFDCSVIVHYPDGFYPTPAAGGIEGQGDFTTVAGTTPVEWNEFCAKLPAVPVFKIDRSRNDKSMSTIHYMTLHKFRLDPYRPFVWEGRWTVLNMRSLNDYREWYFIGEPRP